MNKLMRTVLSITFANVIVFSLVSCGGNAPSVSQGNTEATPSNYANETDRNKSVDYVYDDNEFGVKFNFVYPENWTYALVELKAWHGDETREGAPDSGVQFQFTEADMFGVTAGLYSTLSFDTEHYITEDFETDKGMKGVKYSDISDGRATIFYMLELNGQAPKNLNYISGSGPFYYASINMREKTYEQYQADIEKVINSLEIGSNSTEQTAVTPESASVHNDTFGGNERDFLNSVDGLAIQEVAHNAAKAILRADGRELAKYMSDSNAAERAVKNLTDIYDDLTSFDLVWNPDNIVSDERINISYKYTVEGVDSNSYVSIALDKADDIWKVDWIGLEK